MNFLYAQEHLKCYNYTKKNPLIEVIKKEEGEIIDLFSVRNCIIFLLCGKMLFSSGTTKNKTIEEEEMFVHPYQHKATLEVLKPSELVLMNLNFDLSFCDHFPIENLYDSRLKTDDIYLLDFNPIIKNYIFTLTNFVNDGLRCTYFYELKIKELLYILRAYTPKETLQFFFQPVLNSDMEFHRQVFEGFKKVKTIKELADLMHYSLSGFEKRFKRVFNMPASKWIEKEKGKEIYHEITCSKKTIMEIAYDFGYSPSHFNNYCKRVFGKTPNSLRKSTTRVN